MKNPTEIVKDGKIQAILVRGESAKRGPRFFTPDDFSQQLGLLVHPKGRVIERHRHKPGKRTAVRTQEVLVLLDGKMRVDLFDDDGVKLKAVVLKAGDSILLVRGGHKVTILANAKILAVKQGPFSGPDEKEFY
ncbi:MAG: hypothetical protein NTW38_04965 [Candidatus Aminicenantes bacterium]|nr:hypothetical protein [Candidatus Aminicenantes bacterium]